MRETIGVGAGVSSKGWRGIVSGNTEMTSNIVSLDDGTSNNMARMRLSVTIVAAAQSISGGSTIASFCPTGSPTAGASCGLAAAFNSADYAMSRDGGVAATASNAGVMPTITTGHIGSDPAGNYWGQYITPIAVFPRRLSNLQLQALSAM